MYVANQEVNLFFINKSYIVGFCETLLIVIFVFLLMLWVFKEHFVNIGEKTSKALKVKNVLVVNFLAKIPRFSVFKNGKPRNQLKTVITTGI